MNSERRLCIASLLALSLLLASGAGCADFQRGEYWDSGETGGETGGGGGEDLSFAADVFPILDSGCARCHAPGESAGNTDFLITDVEASYTSALEFVDLDNPAGSRLLSKTAGQGHGGATIFANDTAEYALILSWIEQGALP